MTAVYDVNHIMRNSDIARSIVTGASVPTLCGDSFPVTSHGADGIPGCETGSRTMPTCPMCEAIWSMLPARAAETKPEQVPA